MHEAYLPDEQNALNARQVAYEVIDPALEIFRKYLMGNSDKPERDLEFAVTALLHLSGLAALNVGRVEQLQDFADILAFADGGQVVVTEVTLGAIDANGKLSKLASRAYRIRERYAASGLGSLEVLPLIVTTLPRGAIAADLQKAKASGIAVATKEDLQSVAVQQITFDSSQAFKMLQSLIPQ